MNRPSIIAFAQLFSKNIDNKLTIKIIKIKYTNHSIQELVFLNFILDSILLPLHY